MVTGRRRIVTLQLFGHEFPFPPVALRDHHLPFRICPESIDLPMPEFSLVHMAVLHRELSLPLFLHVQQLALVYVSIRVSDDPLFVYFPLHPIRFVDFPTGKF